MGATLRYTLAGEKIKREVGVDEIACNGYFVMTTKDGITELIPAHRLDSAIVIPDSEDDLEVE
jgi:hypothetical protein